MLAALFPENSLPIRHTSNKRLLIVKLSLFLEFFFFVGVGRFLHDHKISCFSKKEKAHTILTGAKLTELML